MWMMLLHLHINLKADDDDMPYFYPHAFLKKRLGYYKSSVRLSVSPSRYLLLNHWRKSNQIWCVSCSHES